MAHSSLLGADVAPSQPSGRSAEWLGPSDSSDTGSDALGTDELYEDSDTAGTGERGSVTPGDTHDGQDILPDRVVELANGKGFPHADPNARELIDLDVDELPDDDETQEDQARR